MSLHLRATSSGKGKSPREKSNSSPPYSLDSHRPREWTAFEDVQKAIAAYLNRGQRPRTSLSLMILSTSTPNVPNKSHIASNVIGVLCGTLCEVVFSGRLGQRLTGFTVLVQSVCFILLTATFVWWRDLFPSLQSLVRSLRERATTYFSQSAYSHTRPPHLNAEPTTQQTRRTSRDLS